MTRRTTAILMFAGFLLSLFLLPVLIHAAQDVPALTELDQLRVENALLVVKDRENELEKARLALQVLLTRLQKPGYALTRDQSGKLVYAPEKKEPDSSAKP